MIFEIIFIVYLGISALLVAGISILLESSPRGLQDAKGFHLIEEEA